MQAVGNTNSLDQAMRIATILFSRQLNLVCKIYQQTLPGHELHLMADRMIFIENEIIEYQASIL